MIWTDGMVSDSPVIHEWFAYFSRTCHSWFHSRLHRDLRVRTITSRFLHAVAHPICRVVAKVFTREEDCYVSCSHGHVGFISFIITDCSEFMPPRKKKRNVIQVGGEQLQWKPFLCKYCQLAMASLPVYLFHVKRHEKNIRRYWYRNHGNPSRWPCKSSSNQTGV